MRKSGQRRTLVHGAASARIWLGLDCVRVVANKVASKGNSKRGQRARISSRGSSNIRVNPDGTLGTRDAAVGMETGKHLNGYVAAGKTRHGLPAAL